jgi:hypothetical protein
MPWWALGVAMGLTIRLLFAYNPVPLELLSAS